MALILSIETAMEVCAVALGKDGQLLAQQFEKGTNLHSSHLTVFIENLFKETGIDRSQLSAVAVSKGPGSYTGLRIGVSVAKGIAYALGIPLISVSTLEGMARQAVRKLDDEELLYCPMIDARRMEVYCAVYDFHFNKLIQIQPVIVDESSFTEILEESRIVFFGNGMAKCRQLLSAHRNALFMDDIDPTAESLLAPAFEKFSREEFEDVITFEPFYLKEFIAGKPKQAK